jgi:hypothetical protein
LPDGMYIFRPEIAKWINFGGPCNGEDVSIYILWTFSLFYGHLIYFVAIWYILWQFSTFFPRVGKLYEEKSGNPDLGRFAVTKKIAVLLNNLAFRVTALPCPFQVFKRCHLIKTRQVSSIRSKSWLKTITLKKLFVTKSIDCV